MWQGHVRLLITTLPVLALINDALVVGWAAHADKWVGGVGHLANPRSRFTPRPERGTANIDILILQIKSLFIAANNKN